MKKNCFVTGFVHRLGYRDVLSQKMSKTDAKKFKKREEKYLKISIPKYKWAEKLKVECKK